MSAHMALFATASTEPGIAVPARTRLEAYEVETLIAQGRFALVYRAFHTGTGQVVAIKEYFPVAFALRHGSQRVTPRRASDRPHFELGRRAFIDETRSLARFDHPSLVRVLGSFEACGTSYRVMRFTPGPTLQTHRLALGRMPAVEDIRIWIDGLLGALATLHRAGCVHGAVNPDNIVLRPGERPLLLGFDAVRHALEPGKGPGPVSMDSVASATREASASSSRWTATDADDVRALAATLRYCIEGAAPAAASLADTWRREGGPMPIPQVWARLLLAIEACGSGDVRERPQSVVEWRRFLWPTDASASSRVVAAAHARDVDLDDSARSAVPDSMTAVVSIDRAEADPGSSEQAPAAPDAPADAAPPTRNEAAVESETQAVDEASPNAWPSASADTATATPIRQDLTGPIGMPDQPLVATADHGAAIQPPNEAAALPGLVDIAMTDDAVKQLFPRAPPQWFAVATAIALTLLFSVAATLWSSRLVDPPPKPPASPATVTQTAPAVPAVAAAAKTVPTPSVRPEMAAAPDEEKATAEPVPPALAPPEKAPPVALKSAPAQPRKTVAAVVKPRSPQEACAGRKGFALYRCMQLQCAKAAALDHADCVDLR